VKTRIYSFSDYFSLSLDLRFEEGPCAFKSLEETNFGDEKMSRLVSFSRLAVTAARHQRSLPTIVTQRYMATTLSPNPLNFQVLFFLKKNLCFIRVAVRYFSYSARSMSPTSNMLYFDWNKKYILIEVPFLLLYLKNKIKRWVNNSLSIFLQEFEAHRESKEVTIIDVRQPEELLTDGQVINNVYSFRSVTF
jgi:hypothetical protein